MAHDQRTADVEAEVTRLRAERDELRGRLAGDRLQIEGLVNRREGFADIEIGAAYLKGKADALGVALSYLDEYVRGEG